MDKIQLIQVIDAMNLLQLIKEMDTDAMNLMQLKQDMDTDAMDKKVAPRSPLNLIHKHPHWEGSNDVVNLVEPLHFLYELQRVYRLGWCRQLR